MQGMQGMMAPAVPPYVNAENADGLSARLLALAERFRGACLSLQLWVDDDLGLHPRAAAGREPELSDRRLARLCGLSAEAQRAPRRMALPLRLTDRRVGALVAVFEAEPGSAEADQLRCWIEGQEAMLDSALVNERLSRLSGVARRDDSLRAAMSAAHALEQVPSLWDGFAALHQALSTLMEAENFFVVLLDERREWLHFPYYCDQHDHNWEPISFRAGCLQGSMSAIVVAAGRVLRGSSEELLEQAGHGDTSIDDHYGPNASDWMGVPLLLGTEVGGAMVVQSYRPGFKFADVDPGLLSMLAEASAAALYRRRTRETLERLVADRTAALTEARDAAERTLRELRSAQKQLVAAEKMASLGQLVAGVAHEVNTPLGVAFTAATLLETQVQTLDHSLRKGQLARSELDQYVRVAHEASGTVVRNLGRAIRLVQSFKQVSVDRTADTRRNFLLRDCLDDLVESSKSMWKSHPVRVSVRHEPDLWMDSYPGTLGQVLINLIQNALLHAFPDDAHGTIEIIARRAADTQVEIEVRDDGVGIPDHLREKVYEPFFTTQRHRGGTGLGLHIVFNLVTQVLGGVVELESRVGHGSVFRLRLPNRAPH